MPIFWPKTKNELAVDAPKVLMGCLDSASLFGLSGGPKHKLT